MVAGVLEAKAYQINHTYCDNRNSVSALGDQELP